MQQSAIHATQKVVISSEPASVLEHSATHPPGKWSCIFLHRSSTLLLPPLWRATQANLHRCVLRKKEFKALCPALTRGIAPNLLRNQQTESQPSLVFTRPTTDSTKPVATHFGEAVWNQQLKHPGHVANLSGIPQGFALLGQQLKSRWDKRLVHPMREEHTTFQQSLCPLPALNETLLMLVPSTSASLAPFLLFLSLLVFHILTGKKGPIFPSPVGSNTANMQPFSLVSYSYFPFCSLNLLWLISL